MVEDKESKFRQYLKALEKELVAGNATEHTHRPAFKTLIEGLAPGFTATNEPRRIECGAPDFEISKGVLKVGYIKAKDVGTGSIISNTLKILVTSPTIIWYVP